MRTVLLSTIELTDQGETRAYLQLGGRKLIDWQLDLARDFGCQRVICIANGPSSELDGFRARVEQLGMEFHAIGGPLQLVGLVSADQDLLVLGDGVVIDREFLAESFPDRRGVAVVPASVGIDVGFERVDAENAWGGIFIARAQIAEQLAEMPADSDTISLLLRMALQAGTKLVPIDAERLEDGTLLLASTGQIIQSREKTLLDRSSQSKSWLGPGNAIAQLVARHMAKNWIARGPILSLVLTIAAFGAATVLILLLQQYWALVVLLFASLAGSFCLALFNLKAKLLGTERPKYLVLLFIYLTDISVIMSQVYPFTPNWKQRLFVIVVLLASWRLAELVSFEKLQPFWQDRSILLSLLIAAALLGIVPLLTQILTLVALAFCLIVVGKDKITQA